MHDKFVPFGVLWCLYIYLRRVLNPYNYCGQPYCRSLSFWQFWSSLCPLSSNFILSKRQPKNVVGLSWLPGVPHHDPGRLWPLHLGGLHHPLHLQLHAGRSLMSLSHPLSTPSIYCISTPSSPFSSFPISLMPSRLLFTIFVLNLRGLCRLIYEPQFKIDRNQIKTKML